MEGDLSYLCLKIHKNILILYVSSDTPKRSVLIFLQGFGPNSENIVQDFTDIKI